MVVVILTVTDANGLYTKRYYTLEATPCSRGIIDSNAVSCFGQVDGEITITEAFGSQDSLLYALDTVATFHKWCSKYRIPSPYYQRYSYS